jgi:molybdopterin molybdotransferase
VDKLLSVSDALARVLAGASRLGEESTPLARARGRTLAADLVARRSQPPVAVSAMDGFALRAAGLAAGPLRIVGTPQAAAMERRSGRVKPCASSPARRSEA